MLEHRLLAGVAPNSSRELTSAIAAQAAALDAVSSENFVVETLAAIKDSDNRPEALCRAVMNIMEPLDEARLDIQPDFPGMPMVSIMAFCRTLRRMALGRWKYFTSKHKDCFVAFQFGTDPVSEIWSHVTGKEPLPQPESIRRIRAFIRSVSPFAGYGEDPLAGLENAAERNLLLCAAVNWSHIPTWKDEDISPGTKAAMLSLGLADEMDVPPVSVQGESTEQFHELSLRLKAVRGKTLQLSEACGFGKRWNETLEFLSGFFACGRDGEDLDAMADNARKDFGARAAKMGKEISG